MQMKNGCGHNDPALRTTTVQYMFRKEGTQCKLLMEAAAENVEWEESWNPVCA